MSNRDSFAKSVISLQISIDYEGTPCHVVVKDPQLDNEVGGYMWVGGYFFPSGDLRKAVDYLQHIETGAILEPDSIRLKRIVYSKTSLHGHWIANHAFAARARPIEEWKKPGDKDYEVALVETRTLVGQPRIVKNIFGERETKEFKWAINDGHCLARIAFKENEKAREGKKYIQDIPIVNVQVKDAFDLPQGWGLNVGSLIVPHQFKGRHGYVCIKNRDSDNFALIGGKVERLNDVSSANIDIGSCITAEAREEIGLDFNGVSIVGCALTPITSVNPHFKLETDGMNSILNTCVLARPINPLQLDDAINRPEKYISAKEREKIQGIYFFSDEEYSDIVGKGKMRTPDMGPLAAQHLEGCPAERPSLESIVVIHDGNVLHPLPVESLRAETKPLHKW